MTKVASRPEWPRLVASIIVGVTVVVGLTTLVLVGLNAGTPGVQGLAGTGSRVVDALFGLALLSYPLVGAVIIARQPQNRIGWLFAGGLCLAIGNLAQDFGFYAVLTEPGLRSAGEVSFWLASWIPAPAFFLMTSLLVLLFPDGRPLSSRWRPFIWIALVASAAVSIGFAFSSGEVLAVDFIENPFGIRAADAIIGVIVPLGFLGFLIALLGSVASLVVRFRRSRGVEREQLKWLLSAATFLALAWIGGSIFDQVAFQQYEEGPVSDILLNVAVVLIPLSVGVAILRYHLYDIDFIINRALVYGLLTAFLAGLYAASIQLFKVIFQNVSGESSDGSIIITTLLLAAAFTPAKNRLQKVVDRYFGPAHTPTKRLDAYAERMSAFVQIVDQRASAGEFLASSVESLDLAGGTVYLIEDGEPVCVAIEGSGEGEQPVRIAITHDGHEAGFLLLGPRLDGLAYEAHEIATLESTAALVSRAIVLTGARNEASASQRPVTTA